MAKGREPKSVQNRHAYSRISYLYQAATLFALRDGKTLQALPTLMAPPCSQVQMDSSKNATEPVSQAPLELSNPFSANHAIARRLLTDMRSISLKTQIRLNTRLKRTLCKFCDTLQVEGTTCTSIVENESKGGQKPWADVLVCRCLTCGRAKRYPIGADRPKRRPERDSQLKKGCQSSEPRGV